MNDKKQAEIIQYISQLRLMDDIFMAKCFENSIECTELLLHLVMKPMRPEVKEVQIAWQEANAGLKVSATDHHRRIYEILVFRNDAEPKIGPYCCLMEEPSLQLDYTHRAPDYSFIIHIAEHGTVRKPVSRGGIIFDYWPDDGHYALSVTTLYVNCDRKNRSPLGRLMYDFSCTDPSYMNYDLLADRVRYFKEDSEGIQAMCEIIAQKEKKLAEPKELS